MASSETVHYPLCTQVLLRLLLLDLSTTSRLLIIIEYRYQTYTPTSLHTHLPLLHWLVLEALWCLTRHTHQIPRAFASPLLSRRPPTWIPTKNSRSKTLSTNTPPHRCLLSRAQWLHNHRLRTGFPAARLGHQAFFCTPPFASVLTSSTEILHTVENFQQPTTLAGTSLARALLTGVCLQLPIMKTLCLLHHIPYQNTH